MYSDNITNNNPFLLLGVIAEFIPVIAFLGDYRFHTESGFANIITINTDTLSTDT